MTVPSVLLKLRTSNKTIEMAMSSIRLNLVQVVNSDLPRKATGPAKFLDGHARVSLFEEANDLLIGKSGLFYSRYSPKLADFAPSLWYDRKGAGHLFNWKNFTS
jgi:hypothetical protein